MTTKNGGGLGDAEPVEPEYEALEPAPADLVSDFVHYSLDQFQVTRAMWAANYFTLWPLGISLVGTIGVDEETGFRTVTDLHVREWTHERGEGEMIEQTKAENNKCYEEWLAFVRERILDMKVAERKVALERLTTRTPVSDPAQILIAR